MWHKNIEHVPKTIIHESYTIHRDEKKFTVIYMCMLLNLVATSSLWKCQDNKESA